METVLQVGVNKQLAHAHQQWRKNSISCFSTERELRRVVMVPRRATPRAGSRRIDAALDALRPMGFPEFEVRRTVKNLLKIYGGDDGWTFLEEGYYRLVIDTMIEEQENRPEPEENAGTEVGSSTEKSSLKDDDSGEQDSSRVETPPADLPPSMDTPRSREGGALHVKLEAQDTQVQSRHIDSLPKKDIISPCSLRNGTSQEKQCMTPDAPRPTRRPCYGWISSDEDDDEDLVYSSPARILP